MRTFGLIGFPLGHSFSQKYFAEKFEREGLADCEFRNFPLENISELPTLINNNPGLHGLSITIPYKQSVIPFLDVLDATAGEIGAVNCVNLTPLSPLARERGSKGIRSIGHNTDVFGFEYSLIPLLRSHHTHALLLGTGGASKAVAWILAKLKINFRHVSRNKDGVRYSSLNKKIIESHTLIINTTPLGMFPKVNDCPDIPYEYLSSIHLLYDLTYNPEESLFLKKGKAKGAQIKNGLEMLQLQAEEAWRVWNEAPPQPSPLGK